MKVVDLVERQTDDDVKTAISSIKWTDAKHILRDYLRDHCSIRR